MRWAAPPTHESARRRPPPTPIACRQSSAAFSGQMTYTPPESLQHHAEPWPGLGSGHATDADELREMFDEAIGSDAALDRESLMPSGLAEWFVVAQTAIPALLYVPGAQAFRLQIRIASYAVALIGFAAWWFKRGGHRSLAHPSERWLMLAVIYLGLMVFHPMTSGLQAGIAQV